MKKYMCEKCGYIEEKEDITEDYICPMCGAPKESFKELEETNISPEEINAVIDSVIDNILESNV